ncbi:MAG: MATE family efflux transporter [Lachnospiraceae bacterium]|nr:MATE family efflux transporter [Lachnospiraceae bacterium]
MKKQLLQDFTSGGIWGKLLRFTLPMFLANILQLVYNTVDSIVVGRSLGNIGISAVSVGGELTGFLTIVVMGLSGAAQIIISQNIGAGKKEQIGKTVGTLSVFLLITAAVLTTAGIVFRRAFLSVMNMPAEAFEEAASYCAVTMAGLVVVYGYNVVGGLLRGIGDSKHPLIFIIISSCCNIGLDILFVVVFRLGAFGAGLATVLSQIICFTSALIFLRNNRDNLGFDISLSDFRIDSSILKSILKLGIPMAIRSSAVQLSKLFTNSYINSYGLIVCSVTSIGTRISSIATVVGNSFSSSGGSMIGQNIGAEKYDRVLKIIITIFAICLGAAALFGLVLLLFPEQIFMIFTNDRNILPVAMEYVPILIVMFFANATRTSATAFINGSGNHVINLIVALLDALVLRVGLSLLFGLVFGMEYRGFWLGNAVTGFVPMIIAGIYLASGKWKTRKYVVKE